MLLASSSAWARSGWPICGQDSRLGVNRDPRARVLTCFVQRPVSTGCVAPVGLDDRDRMLLGRLQETSLGQVVPRLNAGYVHEVVLALQYPDHRDTPGRDESQVVAGVLEQRVGRAHQDDQVCPAGFVQGSALVLDAVQRADTRHVGDHDNRVQPVRRTDDSLGRALSPTTDLRFLRPSQVPKDRALTGLGAPRPDYVVRASLAGDPFVPFRRDPPGSRATSRAPPTSHRPRRRSPSAGPRVLVEPDSGPGTERCRARAWSAGTSTGVQGADQSISDGPHTHLNLSISPAPQGRHTGSRSVHRRSRGQLNPASHRHRIHPGSVASPPASPGTSSQPHPAP